MVDVVKLATFLETKLNLNTQSLVFRVYTFEKALDRRYETDIAGVKTSFIPSIITTPIGSYLPLADVQGARMSFNLEILLPLSNKIAWLDMLNAFVYTINGKVFYISTSGTYSSTYSSGCTTAKFVCNVPSFGQVNSDNLEVLKDVESYLPINRTENYVAISVPISMKTIVGYVVGDEVTVSLGTVVTTGEWASITLAQYNLLAGTGYQLAVASIINSTANLITYLNANGNPASTSLYAVAKCVSSTGTSICVSNPQHSYNATYFRLKVTDFSVKNAKIPETNQFIDGTTGESFVKENDVKYVMTAFYERLTILDNLIYDISRGTNPNKNYWLKIIYPNSTEYVKVITMENNAIFMIDDYAMIPLVFTKALINVT